MYTHISHMYISRHTSTGERDYVTLLFEIREERKRLMGGYLPQPNGLLVSMAADYQGPCPVPGRRESGRVARLH